jgi:hypothetical protein
MPRRIDVRSPLPRVTGLVDLEGRVLLGSRNPRLMKGAPPGAPSPAPIDSDQ